MSRGAPNNVPPVIVLLFYGSALLHGAAKPGNGLLKAPDPLGNLSLKTVGGLVPTH